MSLDTFASLLADTLDSPNDETRVRRDFENRHNGYLSDPARWARDFIDWRGESLTAYQEEILTDLQAKGREAVRGPHGLGKTTTAALAVLWFAVTREALGIDWKVVTTAGAWRQLIKFLWPEIHKWARRLKWDEIGIRPWRDGKELLDLSISLTYGEAFASASSQKEFIEGAHADHILYVFDEAKAIPADIWDAAEGAFSGATDGRVALALAQSTPGEPNGRFYDIHSRRPGFEDWNTRHVSRAETITANRMSPDWAEQRRKQWGQESAVYANRVLGEFHSSDEDSVVPLEWIEAANARWREWDDAGRPFDVADSVGVDVAREGQDKTALALKFGAVISEIRRYSKQATTATTGRVIGILDMYPGMRAVPDVIGVGGGVVDQLREQGYPVSPFNASETHNIKHLRDRSGELGFVNARAAAWWNLREMLDPDFDAILALPPDDDLTGDLTSPKWRVMSGGRIQIEAKADIKKRIGRSPDAGDAVVQACFWLLPEVNSIVYDEDMGYERVSIGPAI